MPAAQAPGLDSLPDDLLGACLGFLEPQDGQHVTLVSKRFRRLFYEQPSLWREFVLALPPTQSRKRLEAKLALLQRVAPRVSSFAVVTRSKWKLDGSDRLPPLTQFLEVLPPSLEALALMRTTRQPLPADTAQLVRRFTALQSLRVQTLTAAQGLPAALLCLPQLEQLDVRLNSCPAGLVDALAQLPSLTMLMLGVFSAVPELQQLTRLSQLRQLQLEGFGRSLRPPAPLAFPHLEGLKLEAGRRGVVEIAGTQCASLHWGPAQLPDDVTQEQHTLAALKLASAELGSLGALLSAVVPAAAPLQILDWHGVQFSATVLQGCTRVAGLQRLSLTACQFDAAAAAALFSCSQQLTALKLTMAPSQEPNGPPPLPLGALQLPPQLQWLILSTRLDGLPPELAQLSRLRTLDVRHCRLTLTEDDAAVLSRLPQLRRLALPHPGPPSSNASGDPGQDLQAAKPCLLALMHSMPNLRVGFFR